MSRKHSPLTTAQITKRDEDARVAAREAALAVAKKHKIDEAAAIALADTVSAAVKVAIEAHDKELAAAAASDAADMEAAGTGPDRVFDISHGVMLLREGQRYAQHALNKISMPEYAKWVKDVSEFLISNG